MENLNPYRGLLRWYAQHRRDIYGNFAPIDPAHPQAPPNHPRHGRKLVQSARIVAYANASLHFAGHMVYSEQGDRSQLFHRTPGNFAGAHADCSQYVAAILHWLGVTVVDDRDYTGTLLTKGRPAAQPKPGLVAVWGPGTGAHTAFVTERTRDGKDWYVVGFGHQAAPDRNTLTGMNTYFQTVGRPGVRFLDFTGTSDG